MSAIRHPYLAWRPAYIKDTNRGRAQDSMEHLLCEQNLRLITSEYNRELVHDFNSHDKLKTNSTQSKSPWRSTYRYHSYWRWELYVWSNLGIQFVELLEETAFCLECPIVESWVVCWRIIDLRMLLYQCLLCATQHKSNYPIGIDITFKKQCILVPKKTLHV